MERNPAFAAKLAAFNHEADTMARDRETGNLGSIH